MPKPIPPLYALLAAELEWQAVQEQRRQQEIQDALSAVEQQQRQASQNEGLWRLYRNDPVAWVHDMIEWKPGEGPTFYQEEILAEVPIRKRVAFYGPHVIGKTALESWLVLWFSLTRDGNDWKVPTTATAWRQLTHYLWPEIRKWARRLRWDKLGREAFRRGQELLQLSLKFGTGEAFAVASDEPANIEGAHADHLLGLFDESKAIPDATFDAMEGAFAGTGETFVVAASTPGAPLGRFYDICSRKVGTEDWWVKHVTRDDAIRAGRMSEEWAENRKRLWGEHSAVYKQRVLGDFAVDDEDTVIPLAWVEAAIERWRAIMEAVDDDGNRINPELPPFTGVGVDVGTGSVKADLSTLALLYGDVVSEIRKYQYADTMETAGRVRGILDKHGGYAVVDSNGIGAGVLDRLREQRKRVFGFVAGAASREDDGKTRKRDRSGEFTFADRRAEAWWTTRERLDPAYGSTLALPPDDTMIGDLTAPKSRILSGGSIRVESKDDLRKADRLGRSTDVGDAVVQIVGMQPVRESKAVLPIGIPRSGEKYT